MRVLMFGWEFPPHIAGGLGTACYGMTRGLARNGVDVTFVVPHAYGDEDQRFIHVVNASDVEALYGSTGSGADDVLEKMSFIHIDSNMVPYISPEEYESYHEQYVKTGQKTWSTTDAWKQRYTFSGKYGANLMEEVARYAVVAAQVARDLEGQFDVIHAHDWMTYLAGVEVKKATGKPLVVHLHASQFDRAGADARGWIYDIEKFGMEQADAVIPVSKYTGTVASGHYAIDPHKIFPIHNGADPVQVFKGKKKFPEKLVLFLGRLTAQKGPGFFLQIAAKVLEQTDDVRFVMAGTGEKLRQLIESGAFKGVGDKFHFTGFLNKDKVNDLRSITDIYCMPSVSEPFGLSALEAAQFNIPAVISKQSGVAEVMKGALKADFWDVNKMAEHIVNLCTDEELYRKVVEQSTEDIKASTWDSAADKVIRVYEHVLNR